jgi:hypothetical protein
MYKPALLRAALVAALPQLAKDPARLLVYIDKGQISATQSTGDGWRNSYVLNIIITELTGDPDLAYLAIVQWLKQNQPDLLQPGKDKGFRYQADILDNDSVDLEFHMDLTETAIATSNGKGGWIITPVIDPVPLIADDAPLTDPEVLLKSVLGNGEPLLP